MSTSFSQRLNILNNLSINKLQQNAERSLKQKVEGSMIDLSEEIKMPSKNSENFENQEDINHNPKKFSISGKKNTPKRSGTKPQLSTDFKSQKKVTPLFIGGLGPHVTESMLKELFNKFSSLYSVKICYDSETKKSLGYGYLNFSGSDEIDRVIEEFNYTEVFGSEIKIMPSLRNSLYRKNIGTNIFFSNLPLENSELTTRVFYDTFKKYGKILSCKLDHRKNIGFVYYEDDKVAREVIEKYNNTTFFGAKILCGLHFDKELRNFPDFEKRKSYLDKHIILEDELNTVEGKTSMLTKIKSSLPHPNAVFVKNLPIDTTEDEILDFFSVVGPVKSVFTSKVLKFKSEWAFITYKKGSDTERAIEELDGKKYKDRKISVTKAKARQQQHHHHQQQQQQQQQPIVKKASTKTTIQLNNLSTICTKEFLVELCIQEHLKFDRLKITEYEPDSGTFKGFATFKTKDDAKKFYNYLNGKLVGGSVINATFAAAKTNIGEADGKESANSETQGSASHFSMTKPQFPMPLQYFNPYYWGPPQGVHTRNVLPLYRNVQEMPTSNFFRQKSEHVTDTLKRQIKRAINYLKIQIIVKEKNLNCIAEYIVNVFWCGDLTNLSRYLLLLNTNIHYEEILHRQIEEAISKLGFTKGI
ncbi:hypothetical protein KAFR_0A00980 [Kazachstania africana CBS 2517]|uniref:RRM domain-containing protein n=1 Tax=Kazachstania africana (strain ATCC 22294 / BCRC 22015 / CBS 2517 / CECT 1963 / NBRC 1671 / NRRL Y-8276) TaxID=1071382 RepID=H2AMD6_KAZAF|nr:hypothetical protein KAFR_0A00980 [Kazachstania africana CBS 2517]CCF55536.1 hypothetical protein KAFR_0A00980 [Kazachstania africana CBS 2517]